MHLWKILQKSIFWYPENKTLQFTRVIPVLKTKTASHNQVLQTFEKKAMNISMLFERKSIGTPVFFISDRKKLFHLLVLN